MTSSECELLCIFCRPGSRCTSSLLMLWGSCIPCRPCCASLMGHMDDDLSWNVFDILANRNEWRTGVGGVAAWMLQTAMSSEGAWTLSSRL
eukprot:1156136-Pelagomonas_calceolata.AAC.8